MTHDASTVARWRRWTPRPREGAPWADRTRAARSRSPTPPRPASSGSQKASGRSDVAVDLLHRTDRDLGDLQRRLTEWLRAQGILDDRVIEKARHAPGAGTANETVLVDCRTPEGVRGLVVRLTVPGAAAYLDVDPE